MPLSDEEYASTLRALRSILVDAQDYKEQLVEVAEAVDFTADQWAYMYTNHRRLAELLSALNFKYATE